MRRYLQTVRERRWIVLATFVIVFGLAAAYVAAATRVYEAQTDVLVTPVQSIDPVAGLGPIVESSDPTLAVETAAQLISTPAIAEETIIRLGPDAPTDDPQQLLEQVSVEPVSQSNILAVTAEADTAAEAATLSNTFARAGVDSRDEALNERIDEKVRQLRRSLGALPRGSAEAREQAALLVDLQVRDKDPSLQVVTPAIPPETFARPRVALILIAAALGGLVLGVAIAVALRLFDPRLRREEQLRSLLDLPVLARVPDERAMGKRPMPPQTLSAQSVEAYRTLRATLAARAPGDGPVSILITGASPGEGKTTTAISLASSFALAGSRVILIEADLRRPAIARTLEVEVEKGVVSVLTENCEIEEALVPAPIVVSGLGLLLSDYSGPGNAGELFALPIAEKLIDDAKQLADVVIVDSPPLTEVIDALPLAQRSDMVVIVSRLGQSDLRRIKELGELLADSGVTPAGFALLGTAATGGRGERAKGISVEDRKAAAKSK